MKGRRAAGEALRGFGGGGSRLRLEKFILKSDENIYVFIAAAAA